MFTQSKRRPKATAVGQETAKRSRPDKSLEYHYRPAAGRPASQGPVIVAKPSYHYPSPLAAGLTFRHCYQQGLSHYQKKEYPAAIEWLSGAMSKCSRNVQEYMAVCEARMHVYFVSGDHERALADARTAIRVGHKSAQIFYVAALCLRRLGLHGPAMDLCRTGVQLCDSESEHYQRLQTLHDEYKRTLKCGKVDLIATRGRDRTFDPILHLPAELVLAVFEHLDTKDRFRCIQVCWYWHDYLTSLREIWGGCEFDGSWRRFDPRSIAQHVSPNHATPSPLSYIYQSFKWAGSRLRSVSIPDCRALGVKQATLSYIGESRRPLLKQIKLGHITGKYFQAGDLEHLLRRLNPRILTHLHLPYCSVLTPRLLRQVIFLCTSLVSVDVSGCFQHVPGGGCVVLVNTMRSVYQNELVRPRLRELICDDHPDNIHCLWPSVCAPYFRDLQVLKLRWIQADRGAFSMAAAGPHNQHFPWQWAGAHALPQRRPHNSQCVPVSWLEFPSLEHLHLDKVMPWACIATDLHNYTDAGGQAIVGDFKPLPSCLKTLSLGSAFSLHDDVLVQWTAHTFNLRYLDLSCSQLLTNQTMAHLIPRCRDLETLILKDCISIDGHALAELVGSCSRLRNLDLSCTMADNRVLDALLEAAGSLKSVIDLRLDGTRITGAKLLQWVGEKARFSCYSQLRLQNLSINNCEAVGKDAVDRIRMLLLPQYPAVPREEPLTSIYFHFS